MVVHNKVGKNDEFIALVPDWTLRDLFLYLDPSLVSGLLETSEQVGQEILNKLSVGALKSWGSPVDNPTQIAIEPSYWQHVRFTYFFLGKEGENPVWVTDIKLGHNYMASRQFRQVWVSRAEALHVWPKPIKQL